MSSFKRLSRLFAPLRKFRASEESTSVDLLVNYGYIRQSSSGVYNILPLGNIVQTRIESIIRKRLEKVDAAETSLCTLASTKIWKTSGRLETGKEFFMVEDGKFLLAPTNEEEITTMMTELSSYKQVPLRLYQISRKYRNEKRPRGGLLRGREFTMKDLYSFDETKDDAMKSYKDIQGAYDEIFNDIGLKFEVAEADSGSIGGSLSHEYHYISDAGEDAVVKCDGCNYTANTERATSIPEESAVMGLEDWGVEVKFFTTAEHLSGTPATTSIIATIFPSNRTVNTHLLKEYSDKVSDLIEINHSDLDHLLITNTTSILPLVDLRVKYQPRYEQSVINLLENIAKPSIPTTSTTYQSPLHIPIVDVEKGETCPSCKSSKLQIHPAIEIGHTFYLGTKYSSPLNARITTRSTGHMEPLYMGCYGIGVSRLISAIAEKTRDKDGLIWPKSVTPFDAVIVSSNEDDAIKIHEQLAKYDINSVWDDRSNQFGVLLANARGTGFPLAIIAGKNYLQSGQLEIQVRNKPTKTGTIPVSFEHLASTARSLLNNYTLTSH